MDKPAHHADGSEIFRERTAAEQAAEQNRIAAESCMRSAGERRKRDRGCNLIGEQRRRTDRRKL